jgi:hypothetical protein
VAGAVAVSSPRDCHRRASYPEFGLVVLMQIDCAQINRRPIDR